MNIHFVSLGCDKNLVDSEIMLGVINGEGHVITAEEEKADVIIINTCGFIMDATNESVETVLRMAQHKKDGQCKGLIVTGCMAQRYKKEIFEELPEVDAVVGVGDFEAIGQVIQQVAINGPNGEKVELITDQNHDVNEELTLKRVLATPGHFAYVKIAEGCDKCCTYCTIPSIRGKYRSRAMEAIVKEVQMLADRGVKEIILVAQDTSLYGQDIYGKPVLHKLLRNISVVDGVRWIRILYCYPEHLTDETINEMAGNSKVCRYIDMPIQHGNDVVLKRMGRQSSQGQIRSVVNKLRAQMPDISIRTTIITGFPGETDENFKDMLGFVKEMQFDKLGVFAYSKEEGTPAHDMPDQVEESIKKQRLDKIMKAQRKISAQKNESLVGKKMDVIVDGYLPEDDTYCGRSSRDCYDIDGLVFFKSPYEKLTGDFVQVEIVGGDDYDLLGELLEEEMQ